jgi:putative flippase GtrA
LWKSDNFQVFRFVAAGGLSTLSHWVVMALMIFAAVLPELATAAGALVGAGVNYVLQKSFTFQSMQRHRSTLPRYVFACTFLWMANLLVFSTMIRLLNVQLITAQLITTALVAILSYGLFKKSVFNDARLSSAS